MRENWQLAIGNRQGATVVADEATQRNRQWAIGKRLRFSEIPLPIAHCLLPCFASLCSQGRASLAKTVAYCLLLIATIGCGTNKATFSPTKKYSPEKLQKDYSIFRDILEEAHPGLYWYTSKDSMNYFFDWGRQQLNDSLTETDFRKVLTYVTARINCGHTSVRASKAFIKYQDTTGVLRIFPLSMKLWPGQNGQDTMVVTGNLNRRDSLLKRGTIVTKINGRTTAQITDTLCKYIPTDGHNRTHRLQSLSNRGYFGSLYSSVFGYSPRYTIEYLDSLGNQQTTTVRLYYPALDTANRALLIPPARMPQPPRRERRERQLNAIRLLKLDTVNHTAFMDLGSFGRGYGLKGFFRRSFKALKKHKIGHLVIDVRGNGGGSVTNSTLLTKFLADHSFKVGDSLYAVTKRKRYSRYIQNDFFNRLFISFFAGKKKDGLYHFRYFEKHYFKPKKKNHFDGKTYILTGGNSFSATTLFVGAIKDQKNVTVVGEETGGGAYGNNAWLIPDVILPETKVRFRLPLFRLVINKDNPKDGRGVQPEVESFPSIEAIRRGADYKTEKALELIKEDKESPSKVN